MKADITGKNKQRVRPSINRKLLKEGKKWCPKCECILPLNEFYKSKGTVYGYCKSCTKKHVVKYSIDMVTRRYGLSREEYDAIIQSANGICCICLLKPSRLVLDHCHTTNKIRGAICDRCNSLLGLAKDNPSTLKRAASYLLGDSS